MEQKAMTPEKSRGADHILKYLRMGSSCDVIISDRIFYGSESETIPFISGIRTIDDVVTKLILVHIGAALITTVHFALRSIAKLFILA